jgi:tetratricopeptide (TPR) repeat protein
MAISRSHKFFNKFTGWARHEAIVRAEEPRARGEFLVRPERVPAEASDLALELFFDWFLLDRKLVSANLTPLELFIESLSKKSKDRPIYESFHNRKLFGFFIVEDVTPGESFKIRSAAEGITHLVVDERGSRDAEPGQALIARLLPFDDHWTIPSFVLRLPDEMAYILKRRYADGSTSKEQALKPRDALKLLLPKQVWEEAGLPYVRAGLSALLQRWGSPRSASELEDSLKKALDSGGGPDELIHAAVEDAPSLEDANEASRLLSALWNLNLPSSAGKDRPGPGRMERTLLSAFSDELLREADLEKPQDVSALRRLSRQRCAAWLDVPQKELAGRTPREIILEERGASGNPETRIGWSLNLSESDIDKTLGEASRRVNDAIDMIRSGDAAAALPLLEQAYPAFKKSGHACRILGNIATCHAMLGRRERALEALRAALQADPDYKVARDNLHLLETMSPEEFDLRHTEGFFGNSRKPRQR